MTTETKRLVNDLKIIGRDTEDLIKATAGDVTEKAKEARSRLVTAVDAEDLALYTGLCVKTIRREIEDRNLPHHKVRGRLIIAVSDALAWLSARREG